MGLSLCSHYFADHFDPDDLYKMDEATQSRSNSPSGSEDERTRPRWFNQPTAYAYDALKERNHSRDIMRPTNLAATEA